ncbi:Uncharacterized conserved protein YafD, endonuclease/exonuclease/phosphatase (EEP) superfamily [Amycolatopsis arida]|uniref:Uncharacterized conserved protein YafD, endonuclease/exonuclease/phosphatase (EEP) superfamily n=1 Tax=Amycolatopsis arida TaxID=587909 RepID=A0A1I5R608_9PSEU|nr:endonuclease/exonuclease/phosphatase (EEP) superfamily protein YafD [Amycolatopsis arida]SFP53496.1 Uncharacterized conserved protein YafD, endonuclease/exonuclease/phosphatase (EEP) superfamily [Amycolatopsis arida]
MLVDVVLLVVAVPFAGLVLLRLAGIDGNRHTAAALALTPYAAVAGLVLSGLAMALRRWWVGAPVLLLAVVLVLVVLPRAVPAGRPDPGGPELRVLSANLFLGRADPRRVVELVREHDVDVLVLLEAHAAAVRGLTEAGLFTLLPERVHRAGSALLSRYPLTELALAEPSTLGQPSARVRLPGGTAVEVVAVHSRPPVEAFDTWRAELGRLPAADPDGPPRILAGDFNATLDHAALRRVLAGGYRDAGAERGKGLMPTWPGRWFPPPVTIDHVLVDSRVAVREYRVRPLPGGDHDAVYARLALPAG